ncbi:MAG: pyridoxal phosphate-dependent aminotransferase [Deltaproteobacteria bacterium]|nr:pyridoxal phosphate-dependent aminotransferase [Deltaproteobacteria bacterium]
MMNEKSKALGRVTPMVQESESSPIRRMMKMMEERSDLLNLSAGEAAFDAPDTLIEAAVSAMREGRNRYTSTNGTPGIRNAVASFLKAEMGVSVDPDENVLMTVGGMEAIFLAFRLLVGAGDEVLLPDPGWGILRPITDRLGGTLRFYPLKKGDAWTIDPQAILDNISDTTKLVVINTPSNPTGATLSREGYAAVLEKAREHGVFVLSDEVYHNYVYEGGHVSALQFDHLDHVIMVNSFSKTFAVTGWRLGYAVAHPWVIRQMSVFKETISLCSFSIGQWALAGYLAGSRPYLDRVRELCRGNMERVVERLNAIPGVRCPKPVGGFYAFADFSGIEPSDEALFRRFLDGGVALVPGGFFGSQGAGHARIMFATDRALIDRALDRMEAALAS